MFFVYSDFEGYESKQGRGRKRESVRALGMGTWRKA
jgi:hypothetical protein